jgi:hypothetical protein
MQLFYLIPRPWSWTPPPMINLFVLPKQAINITKTNSSSRYISVLKTAYTDASV